MSTGSVWGTTLPTRTSRVASGTPPVTNDVRRALYSRDACSLTGLALTSIRVGSTYQSLILADRDADVGSVIMLSMK